MSSDPTPNPPSPPPQKIKNFEPKTPVHLNPPKNDEISPEELSTWDGSDPAKPTAVAIKGTVFDVSGNKSYMEGGPYRSLFLDLAGSLCLLRAHFRALVFAGHDASRALAQSSLKEEDVRGEWEDLGEKEKGVLEEWVTFFGKRYNVLGKVKGRVELE